MAITFFAIIGTALYRASKTSPALAERLKKFALNLRNQIRLKQASTMVQIMGIVSSLSLPFPLWFPPIFILLIVLATWPFSFQPTRLEFVYVPSSFQGLVLFALTQTIIYVLAGLDGYKWLSTRLSKDFCRSTYSIKATREMVGRRWEGGDTGVDAAEEPTGSADVEVELRQNPLHIDDKDGRKSEKREMDGVKSEKDKKIMESFTQYMNPGVKEKKKEKTSTKGK